MKNLVPCDRCGLSARINPALILIAMPHDEAARLTLARHQAAAKCVVRTFELKMTARDFVRVGKAWRLLEGGLVAFETGPSSYRPQDDVETLTYGKWIPRWAAVIWFTYPNAKDARYFAGIVGRATDDERAALLTSWDLGGAEAARQMLWEIAVRRGELRWR